MIDSHCHIDLPAFDADRYGVLSRCLEKGVTGIVIPGVTPAQSDKAHRIIADLDSHQLEGLRLWQMIGLHPQELTADYDSKQTLSSLRTILMNAVERYRPVAIGEAGFDSRLDQALPFKALMNLHCEIATSVGLPLCVHSVRTHNAVLQQLKRVNFAEGGIVHAFSGSYEEAMQYIDRGFALGIGGTISYERARKTRDAVRRVPLEAIVLETDAPDMPLAGYQGQRNSPERLVEVANAVAELRDIDPNQLKRATIQNTHRTLRLG